MCQERCPPDRPGLVGAAVGPTTEPAEEPKPALPALVIAVVWLLTVRSLGVLAGPAAPAHLRPGEAGQFMTVVGTVMNAIFLLAIILQAIPLVVLRPCA